MCMLSSILEVKTACYDMVYDKNNSAKKIQQKKNPPIYMTGLFFRQLVRVLFKLDTQFQTKIKQVFLDRIILYKA